MLLLQLLVAECWRNMSVLRKRSVIFGHTNITVFYSNNKIYQKRGLSA